MNSVISIALLIAGLTLVSWGVITADSFSSDVSRFFTGSPSEKTYWLMIGGFVTAIFGIFGLLRESNKA